VLKIVNNRTPYLGKALHLNYLELSEELEMIMFSSRVACKVILNMTRHDMNTNKFMLFKEIKHCLITLVPVELGFEIIILEQVVFVVFSRFCASSRHLADKPLPLLLLRIFEKGGVAG